MKQDTLTETERRFIEALERAEGCSMAGAMTTPDYIRSRVRTVAYHEAAHVAARMFTGQEAAHIVFVSIIPESDTDGRERSRMNIAEIALAHYPPPMMRAAGRCLLLALLAGRGADVRIAAPEYREDILDDDALWMEGEQEGTDLFRALRIADIMARPGIPAYRVLSLAAKWTEEMLALPDVWRCVETLADMLLERGVIEDIDEIMAVCKPILGAGLILPKWRRRLGVTKAELDAIPRKEIENFLDG
jgi:hypothetical protein